MIKRGRWAAHVPGLRWGGQQVQKGPMVTLDLESYGFDPGHKDFSAFVVAVATEEGFKVYPYQQVFIDALMRGDDLRFPVRRPRGPNIQNLRPHLSSEQAADVAFIRDALREAYGYPVAENRDKADSD